MSIQQTETSRTNRPLIDNTCHSKAFWVYTALAVTSFVLIFFFGPWMAVPALFFSAAALNTQRDKKEAIELQTLQPRLTPQKAQRTPATKTSRRWKETAHVVARSGPPKKTPIPAPYGLGKMRMSRQQYIAGFSI